MGGAAVPSAMMLCSLSTAEPFVSKRNLCISKEPVTVSVNWALS